MRPRTVIPKVAAGAAATTALLAGPAYASCGNGTGEVSYANYNGYNACRGSDIQDAPITGHAIAYVDPFACPAPYNMVASSGWVRADVQRRIGSVWTSCAQNDIDLAVRTLHQVQAKGPLSCDQNAAEIANYSYHAVYISGYKAAVYGLVTCQP